MYITVDYIIKQMSETKLAELSNDSNSGTVDVAKVEEIIVEKSGYIDDCLRGRYELPLKNTHTTLQDICYDLVCSKLYKNRPGSKKPEDIKALIDGADYRLERFQSGKSVLNEGTELPETDIHLNFRSSMPKRTYTDSYLSKMT